MHLGNVWNERAKPNVMDFPLVLDEACADLHGVLLEVAEVTEGPLGEAVAEALAARRKSLVSDLVAHLWTTVGDNCGTNAPPATPESTGRIASLW